MNLVVVQSAMLGLVGKAGTLSLIRKYKIAVSMYEDTVFELSTKLYLKEITTDLYRDNLHVGLAWCSDTYGLKCINIVCKL